MKTSVIRGDYKWCERLHKFIGKNRSHPLYWTPVFSIHCYCGLNFVVLRMPVELTVRCRPYDAQTKDG